MEIQAVKQANVFWAISPFLSDRVTITCCEFKLQCVENCLQRHYGLILPLP